MISFLSVLIFSLFPFKFYILSDDSPVFLAFFYTSRYFLFLSHQENVGLKNLNLRMNGFGLEGAKAMAHALIHNRTLMELDLSHNRIPLQGAIAIGKGINCNEVLVTIKVRFIRVVVFSPILNDNSKLLMLSNVIII